MRDSTLRETVKSQNAEMLPCVVCGEPMPGFAGYLCSKCQEKDRLKAKLREIHWRADYWADYHRIGEYADLDLSPTPLL